MIFNLHNTSGKKQQQKNFKYDYFVLTWPHKKNNNNKNNNKKKTKTKTKQKTNKQTKKHQNKFMTSSQIQNCLQHSHLCSNSL